MLFSNFSFFLLFTLLCINKILLLLLLLNQIVIAFVCFHWVLVIRVIAIYIDCNCRVLSHSFNVLFLFFFGLFCFGKGTRVNNREKTKLFGMSWWFCLSFFSFFYLRALFLLVESATIDIYSNKIGFFLLSLWRLVLKESIICIFCFFDVSIIE